MCCPPGSPNAATRSTCSRCTARCRALPRSPISSAYRAGEVDAITFTSSSTVKNFCDAVGAIAGPQPAVISIGPVTSQTAVELGLRVDAEADPHTIDGLVAAVLAALR